MSHAYNAQANGGVEYPAIINEVTEQLGRISGVGLYPFITPPSLPVDLSGAAITTPRIILHTERALKLYKAYLLYTEASSADVGVTLNIGREADADYYYTGTSETSKALYYTADLTLLQTLVAAGDTVTLSMPVGLKTGIGEVSLILEYGYAPA